MNARYSRQRDGYGSTETGRQRSDAFDIEICDRACPGTIWDFLLRSRLLPVGLPALEAIIEQEAWNCDDTWLQLQTKRGPRVVWNAFRGFAASPHLRRQLVEKGGVLKFLNDYSIYDFGSTRDAVKTLGAILEANLGDYFPAGLIGYANGTVSCASPIGIDLNLDRGLISRESRQRKIIADRFPTFFETKSSLRLLLNDDLPPDTRDSLIGSLANAEQSANRSEDREATHWLIELSKKMIVRSKILAHGGVKGLSLLRTLSALPMLVLRMRENSETQELFAYTSNHSAAAKLLYTVCPSETKKCLERQFAAGYWRPSGLEVTLGGFDSVRGHFGLDSPLPHLDDTSRCARRVIHLIVSCGRRLSCVVGVSAGGYIDADLPFLELGRTKVPRCAGFRLPIGVLLPSDDTQFIRMWMKSLSPSQTHQTLLELAGVDPQLMSGTLDHSKIHNAYADLLRKDFGWKTRPRLHDLRRMGVSWLSIRIALSENPHLATLPTLRDSITNSLFSQESLQGLRHELGYEDPLDFIAKIAGHSNRVTTRRTYNFGLPIHTLLEARKKWLSTRNLIPDKEMRLSIERLFGAN